MDLIAVVSLLALIEYMVIAGLVGSARGKYGVKAPATTGNEVFERYFRVQQNTLEQLVVFLPALWLFANYVSTSLGAVIGLAFIIGRAVYLRGYVADPAKRGTGFAISFAANAILVLGGLGGAIVQAL
jgi:glutathione S-transferase